MTIVPLKRVTIIGPSGDKAALNAKGQYILCEPLNRSCKGWTRKTLFPVKDRPSGTVSANDTATGGRARVSAS